MPRQKKNYSKTKRNKLGKSNFKQKNSKPQIASSVNKRSKNFRFIQRSKEAEELQRRQKTIEDKYRTQKSLDPVDKQSDKEDEIEEEDALESLLSTFDNNGKKKQHIESSSDDESDNIQDSNDELEEGEEEELLDDDELYSEELENGEELYEEEVEESDFDSTDHSEDEVSTSSEKLHDQNSNEEEEDAESIDDVEEELDLSNSDKEALKDHFSIHFEDELSQKHIDNLLEKPIPINKSELNWPTLGRLQIEISKSGKTPNSDEPKEKRKKILIDDEHYASEGTQPVLLKLEDNGLEIFGIKHQLAGNIRANRSEKPLTPLQIEILSIISKYQDLSFPQRTLENAEEIRFVYCLHVLNHMAKTRSKILHHNAKLKDAAGKKKTTAIIPDAYRDQGLVRPKVLIILPFRDAAFKVVNNLVDIMYGEKSDLSKTDGTVINYKRFMEEYTGDTLYFPKTNPKPEDYEKTFAGNTDDNFRIGLSMTKKCIKLYTDFYSSDILIASPLGLRMVVGAAGDGERDYDFLTSIEILVLDQAELFLAQNWEHLLHVVDHMHLQPKSTRNTDFSRVRPWCLNGYSRFYRQTLFFTSHELPEFRSLFSSKCHNYRGKVRIVNPIPYGSIRNVFVSIPQVFHKIEVDSIEESFEKRFTYFTDEILPQFKGPSMAHCMIYVPSYFDYVRLRNYFKAETINFVQICEYTKDAKIARARDMFFHSAAHFLLYSERAHFFRRTRIKGIRHLIFYQPPCWPNLYPELLNLMQEGYQNPRDGLENSKSVTVLYTKYDILHVSSIVGTERAGKLLRTNMKSHIFMAGE